MVVINKAAAFLFPHKNSVLFLAKISNLTMFCLETVMVSNLFSAILYTVWLCIDSNI